MTTNLKHQSEKLPDIGHNSGLPKICPCYCPPLMDANIKTKKFAIPTKLSTMWCTQQYATTNKQLGPMHYAPRADIFERIVC